MIPRLFRSALLLALGFHAVASGLRAQEGEYWVLQGVDYRVTSHQKIGSTPLNDWHLIESGSGATEYSGSFEITNAQVSGEAAPWSELPLELGLSLKFSFPEIVPAAPGSYGRASAYGLMVFNDDRPPIPDHPEQELPPILLQMVMGRCLHYGPGPVTRPPMLPPDVDFETWRADYYGADRLADWDPSTEVLRKALSTRPNGLVPSAQSWDVAITANDLASARLSYWFEALVSGDGITLGDAVASRIVFLYPHYALTSSVTALRVDRTDDEVDGDYSTGDLSLREALQQAGTRNKPTTIFFGVNQVTLDAPLVAPENDGHPVTLLGAKTVRLVPPENGPAIEIPVGSRLQLEGLSFTDAVSTSPTAIVENRGDLELRDCLFQKNAVLGGMVKTFDAAQTVGQNCLFLDNGAVSPLFYHGDLVVDGRLGVLELYNSLTAGCPVSIGNRGEMHLKFCTVEGRIMNFPAEGVSLELQNCLIGAADERPDDSLEGILGEAQISSIGGNVFRQLANPAAVLKNGDRRISPLGLYRFGGGYNLKPNSPAINHIDGPPSVEMDPPLEADLFGRPRLAGSAYDAGAIEVTSSLLQALDTLNNATSPDENGNGLPDLVEVLIGIDPAEREAPISEIIVLNTLTGAASSPRPSRQNRRTEITFPLDERAWFGQLTLQTSTDLGTWTDRATYIPQGDGFGYQRLPGEGSTEVSAEVAGYLWTITEAVDAPGSTLYVRLRGEIP